MTLNAFFFLYLLQEFFNPQMDFTSAPTSMSIDHLLGFDDRVLGYSWREEIL
jgi:hypothetical protein